MMTERCGACGTDGVTNSAGRFVSNDWLRANERDKLRDALKLYVAAGFGNSTDFLKQGAAYDAAVEALK